MDKVINERAQHVLKVLVERYIQDGTPVGSKTVADASSLQMSPATIRNVMADLEEVGLLQSPHTSAGRIPTAQGFRLFVDSLLTTQPLDAVEIERFKNELNPNADTKNLMQSASTFLSHISSLAGLVTLPKHEKLILRQVEFLPLSENRILVVLVHNEKEVQNRVIQLPRDFSRDELQLAANYLNAHYAGKELSFARDDLVAHMRNVKTQVSEAMQSIIENADEVFTVESDKDYVMAGETNLLNLTDAVDIKTLQSLFVAFSEKRTILDLLDHCLQADGVQIFIGDESGYEGFDNLSIVTSPYSVEGKVVGVLGVVGPTRMAYDKIIPAVDVTAKLLSAALL